jgi:hypothetical protein
MRLTPLIAVCWLLSCGARSSLLNADTQDADAGPDGGVVEPIVLCESALDCDRTDLCAPEQCIEGVCQVSTKVDCDDSDPCTEDLCNRTTGLCSNETIRSDVDGDGYYAAKPGAAAECGDDCDDAKPNAHPGGLEFCDGADNDCNGSVDEGASYRPVESSELRISADDMSRAGRAGLAFTGSEYAVTYTGKRATWRSYLQRLSASGSPVGALTEVSDVNSETYAGPLVWDGTSFHTAWSDARQDGNYEIYSNRFDATGKKFGPDRRVTQADDFSLHPELTLGPSGPVVVWDDRRPIPNGPLENAAIFGQRFSSDGKLVGNNRLLSNIEHTSEYPSIAFGEKRALVVFTYLAGDIALGGYRTLDLELGDASALHVIPFEHVQSPAVHYLNGYFIITFEMYDVVPGPSIFGMRVSEDGSTGDGPLALTSGAAFARTHSLLPMGDQLILVWADTLDGNYELYYETLFEDLSLKTPRARLTDDPADTLAPMALMGTDGEIAVVFDDWRTGANQVYFTRLSCNPVPE